MLADASQGQVPFFCPLARLEIERRSDQTRKRSTTTTTQQKSISYQDLAAAVTTTATTFVDSLVCYYRPAHEKKKITSVVTMTTTKKWSHSRTFLNAYWRQNMGGESLWASAESTAAAAIPVCCFPSEPKGLLVPHINTACTKGGAEQTQTSKHSQVVFYTHVCT